MSAPKIIFVDMERAATAKTMIAYPQLYGCERDVTYIRIDLLKKIVNDPSKTALSIIDEVRKILDEY